MACKAELLTAIASAPRASALTKSAGDSEAAGDHEGDLVPSDLVEMSARARKRGERGHRDVVAEDQWRRTGATRPAVEDDVVGTGLERKVDIVLDVLRRQLEANRRTTRGTSHLFRDGGKIGWRREV